MEWADQAVVLRIGHFRESDLWLKLLCRGRGLLTLFAFGGSRSRRRFCGCLDVLNTLQCRVKTSGRENFLNLEEAVLLSGPQCLRGNWQRGLVGGIGTTASYAIALWAMTIAPVAVIAALRETSILFGILISAWILHERVTRQRWIAAGLIVLGAVVLRIT